MFPVTNPIQRLEDARFVEFKDAREEDVFYGPSTTATAEWRFFFFRSELIETRDFRIPDGRR